MDRMMGVHFLAWAVIGFFLFATASRCSGTHPAYHSPASSVEVKNAWNYSSSPQ